MLENLEEFLRSRSASYEVIPHPGSVTALEQAAALHTPGWSLAKVVLVKERDGLVMAVLPAPCVLDLNRLKGLIGHGEIRLAALEEIRRAVANCVPGAIPPFGELFGLRSFVDRALLKGRLVTMPGGDLGTVIRMKTPEFRRLAAAARIGDFGVPESLVATPTRRSGPAKPAKVRRG